MKRNSMVILLLCAVFLVSGCATVAEKEPFFYNALAPENIKADAIIRDRESKLGMVQLISTGVGLGGCAVRLITAPYLQSIAVEGLCLFSLAGLGLGSLASWPFGLYENNDEFAWMITATIIGLAAFIPEEISRDYSAVNKVVLITVGTAVFTGAGVIMGKIFNTGMHIIKDIGGNFTEYIGKLSHEKAKELLGDAQKEEKMKNGDVIITWMHDADVYTVPFKYRMKGQKIELSVRYSEELSVIFDKTSKLMKDFKYDKIEKYK